MLSVSTPTYVAPHQETDNIRTHKLFVTITTSSDVQKYYSDQAGKLLHQSTRGNQYVMIMYDYDSNLILSNPIKNRQAAELTSSWKTIFIKLQTNGHAPELHILDNECIEEIRKAFKKHQVTFQLFPLHVHCRNFTERAIQTWKHNFFAWIATLDPNSPIKEWDGLLPQCDITLNLLRSSCRQSPHMQLPLETSTSTKLLSHHQATVSSSTRRPGSAPPSHHMELTAGTSAFQLITTDVTAVKSHQRKAHATQYQWIGFHTKYIFPK